MPGPARPFGATNANGVQLDVRTIAIIQERLKRGRCHEFVSAQRILRENETIGLLDIERQQAEVLDAWEAHRWVMVYKYRQAKVSTAIALALLGMVEYTEGVQGLFIANDGVTGEVVWARSNYAYEHQPPSVRIPIKKNSNAASRTIHFAHNGTVRVISGGGSTPAMGNSPDRVVVTEYPDVPDHETFNEHFFPAVNKRPNARVIFEATPGLGQTVPEVMWHKALDGDSRFHPVFLKWWLDPSIRPYDDDGQPVDCSGLVPTNEELRLIEMMPGITKAHLLFRRLSLDTEFHGDDEAFWHKYPRFERDGWPLSDTPCIPREPLDALYKTAYQIKNGEYKIYEAPDEEYDDHPYVITADPAGYGETGDPSALTVWCAWTGDEVASWSGREDPGKFAERILEVQKEYGRARTLLVVESNKGECVEALRSRGATNLWHTSEKHPGYYATEPSNAEGLVALVDQLRRGQLKIRSRATISQLGQWDGKGRKRRSKTAEGKHHFDRAVTVRIFAHVRRMRNFGSKPLPKGTPRAMTVKDFEARFAPKKPSTVLGVG